MNASVTWSEKPVQIDVLSGVEAIKFISPICEPLRRMRHEPGSIRPPRLQLSHSLQKIGHDGADLSASTPFRLFRGDPLQLGHTRLDVFQLNRLLR